MLVQIFIKGGAFFYSVATSKTNLTGGATYQHQPAINIYSARM